MAEVPFLGCRISLISKCDIRYEGILYCVDAKESTIALSKVKSYGTEDRADPNSGSWVAPKNEVYDIIIFRASDVKDLRVDTPEPPGLSDPAIISARQHAYPSGAPTSSSTSSATVIKNAATMAAAVAAGSARNIINDQKQPETTTTTRNNNIDTRSSNNNKDSSNNRSHNNSESRNDSRRRPTSNPRLPRNNNNDTRGPRDSRDSRDHHHVNNNNNSKSGNNDRRYNSNHQRREPNNLDRGYNKKPVDGRPPGEGRPPGDRRRHDDRRQHNDRRQYNDGRPPFRRGPSQGMRRPRSGDRAPGQGYRGPRKSAPLKFDGEYDFDEANQKFLGIVSKLKSLKLKKDNDAKHSDKLSTEKAQTGDSESGSCYDSEDNNTHKNDDSNDETAAADYYDKTKSFFDTISCEASERSQGKVGKPDWRKERQLNTETFGVSANYRRPGGYRPRVWQSNPAR